MSFKTKKIPQSKSAKISFKQKEDIKEWKPNQDNYLRMADEPETIELQKTKTTSQTRGDFKKSRINVKTTESI